jgi:arrestin-related trafficking adapter 1
MPHRVANFFRSSTENITTTAATALKTAATRRRDSSSRSAGTSRPRVSARDLLSDRALSYASSVSSEGEEGLFAIRMPEVTETSTRTSSHSASGAPPAPAPASSAGTTTTTTTTTHKKHRSLLPFGRSSRESHENASAGLDWKIESPPLIFYGDADNSTGALMSGQLLLEVKEEWLEVDVLEATMNVHVVQKRPFQHHCSNCANQHTELKKWTFLRQPTTLSRGKFRHHPAPSKPPFQHFD